jgi:hypothetical protein
MKPLERMFILVSFPVLLLLSCRHASRESPPEASFRSSTTRHLTVGETKWTLCPAIDSDAAPKLCSQLSEVKKPDPDVCPDNGSVLLVTDNDSVTRNCQRWDWLEKTPWGYESEICRSIARQQPLDTLLPGSCETIQRIGGAGGGLPRNFVGCEPVGSLLSRQSSGADASSTPARLAIERLCGELSNPESGKRRLSIAVVAFDGVPDEVGRGTAAGDFARTLADSCVAQGLGVLVVTNPTTYRYLYILTSATSFSFAEGLANRLKSLMHDADRSVKAPTGCPMAIQSSQTEPFVLKLTPSSLLRSGARREVGEVRLSRLPLQGAEGASMEGFGETSGAVSGDGVKVNVSRWLKARDPNRAAWRIGWNGNQSSWQSLASDGTLLASPEMRGNLALQPTNEGAIGNAFSRFGDARFALFPHNECPANLQRDRLGWNGLPEDCPRPTAELFQSAVVSGNSLTVQLYRDHIGGLGWVSRTNDRSDPLATIDQRSFVSSVRETGGSPLASFALISPGLLLDSCAVRLRKALLNSFTWGLGSPTSEHLDKALEKECSRSPLNPLINSMKETKPARFPLTQVDRTGGSNDLRVGMETLAASIVASAETVTSSARDSATRGWTEATSECTLKSFRVVYECPIPK